MKTKMNFFCMVIFLLVAYSVYDSCATFIEGVVLGVETAERKTTGSEKLQDNGLAVMQTINLMPKSKTFFESTTKLKNSISGKEVKVVPMGDVAVCGNIIKDGDMIQIVGGIVSMVDVACIITLVVIFVLMMIRFNNNEIFSWSNVRAFRYIGFLVIFITLINAMYNAMATNIVLDAFSPEGYTVKYLPDDFTGDMVEGLLALIMAEAFAIGLKLKEEQELTI
jgi:hypothetical protein